MLARGMFGEIGEKKTFGEFYIGDSIAISDHLLFIICTCTNIATSTILYLEEKIFGTSSEVMRTGKPLCS